MAPMAPLAAAINQTEIQPAYVRKCPDMSWVAVSELQDSARSYEPVLLFSERTSRDHRPVIHKVDRGLDGEVRPQFALISR